MENITSSPVTQARVVLTEAKENMGTRLNNSKKIITAFENFELNDKNGYFDNNRQEIENLVKKTASLSKAIETLDEAGIDTETCKIAFPGRVFTTQIARPVADVNAEIENNLNQEVVQAGLRTLGIIEAPKKSIFRMPEAPSNQTIVKGTGALATGAVIGAGAYFHKEIVDGITAGIDYVTLPESVTDFFSDIGETVSTKAGEWSKLAGEYLPDLTGYIPTVEIPSGEKAKELLTSNTAMGVGAVATLAIGAFAVYKVVQNRKNQEAEAAAANAPVVETQVEEATANIA